MEASAVHAPAGLSRVPLAASLLRLRSDEQLLALFRAGNDDAFGMLHDRYRQRLFAYVRQMLSAGSRQDAEDVLQDVFVRAYGALRADGREMNVRAWLYRVAHNRCVDHLRRPVPAAMEVFELSRKPLHDPVEEAQRRDDLKRLVEDVARLPEQQRSALLMREIDGMSYADLAVALDVTVSAVKSLLVRARIGLVEAAEARDADCADIRDDLVRAYDRGVKASGRARRHMRSCAGCREYRTALRGVRRSFAALTPVGVGPLALLAKLAGVGASSAGGAAGGSAAAGGGAAAAGAGSAAVSTGLATVTACKVAAVVCTAVVATGGAVEVNKLTREDRALAGRAATHPAAAVPAGVAAQPAPARATRLALAQQVLPHKPARVAPRARKPARRAHGEHAATSPSWAPTAPAPTGDAAADPAQGGAAAPVDDAAAAGGVRAPDPPAQDGAATASPQPSPAAPVSNSPQPVTTSTPAPTAASDSAPASPPPSLESGGGTAPPDEH